jgi:hypothetical protein
LSFTYNYILLPVLRKKAKTQRLAGFPNFAYKDAGDLNPNRSEDVTRNSPNKVFRKRK